MHFVQYVTNQPEHFFQLIDALEQNHSIANKCNVTYCMPQLNIAVDAKLRALLPQSHSTPRCGVRDLIPNGMTMPVKEHEVERYIALVRNVTEA